MLRRLSLACAAILLSASAANAASITVFTDITGANTQIDTSNWAVWTFSVAPGNSVEDILGSFVIKRGNSTDEPINFSLFGLDASAWNLTTISTTSPIAAFVMDEANVSTSYETRLFPINPTPDLTDANIVYSLVLWSTTASSGAYQYFFKGDETELFVIPCGVIGGENVECGEELPPLVVATPEPSTIVLTLTGIGAVVALSRRRQRRA